MPIAPRKPSSLRNTVTASAGWLFADLLLVLTMLFLATTAVGKVPQPLPTPTVPQVAVSPSPLPRLETTPSVYSFTISHTGILSNSPSAISDFMRQVKQKLPAQRRAGLVIVTVGAPSVSDTGTAIQVGLKLNSILDSMGRQGFVFVETSFHKSLFFLGGSLDNVQIEVYFYHIDE